MKILFVDPPTKIWIPGKYMPNGAYLILSAYLKQNGFNDIHFYDAPVSGNSWKKTIEAIRKIKPEIIATGSKTCDIYRRILLSESVKKVLPHSIFIIGGHHVSFMPEEILRVCKSIDYAVIGEGEDTFLELIKALSQGQKKKDMYSIKGLGFINEKDYVFTKERDLIKDINTLPMPDYSIIPIKRYKEYDFPGNPHKAMRLTFSRGCAFHCNFCTQNLLWKNKYRRRNAVKVVEEMKLLAEKYEKDKFSFGDNDFLTDKSFVENFINEIKKTELNIKFSILARADSILKNEKHIKNLVSIGLVHIKIGVESCSQNNLVEWEKDQNLMQIQKAFETLKRAKIPLITAYMVWGYYNENKKRYLDVVRFADHLGANCLIHSVFSPMPGTQHFKTFINENNKRVLDYRSFDFTHPIVRTKHYSNGQMLIRQTLIHFLWGYSPKRIFKNLFNKYTRHYQFIYFPRMTLRMIIKFLKIGNDFSADKKEKKIMQRMNDYYNQKHKNLNT